MFGVRLEYISYPANEDELKRLWIGMSLCIFLDVAALLMLSMSNGATVLLAITTAAKVRRLILRWHSKLCLTTLAAFWAFPVFNMELAMINTL
jgi:hypothetical protein